MGYDNAFQPTAARLGICDRLAFYCHQLRLRPTPASVAEIKISGPMRIILADYDPGTLTGFYVAFMGGIAVVFCILGSIVCLLLGNRQALKKWALATVVSLVGTIVLGFGTVMLGRIFHWL